MWTLQEARATDVIIYVRWSMGLEMITTRMTIATERVSMHRDGRLCVIQDWYVLMNVRRQMHAAVMYVQLMGSIGGFPQFDPFH
jgi:hypothetical protein